MENKVVKFKNQAEAEQKKPCRQVPSVYGIEATFEQ